MIKRFFVFFGLSGLASSLCGCKTLQERMAERVGCDVKGVGVITQVNAPFHRVYLVKCRTENESYRCTESSFHQVCNRTDGGKSSPAAKPPKSRK